MVPANLDKINDAWTLCTFRLVEKGHNLGESASLQNEYAEGAPPTHSVSQHLKKLKLIEVAHGPMPFCKSNQCESVHSIYKMAMHAPSHSTSLGEDLCEAQKVPKSKLLSQDFNKENSSL